MSERLISYDIETVENDRAEDYWDQVHVAAPQNYKDQEKITSYIQTKRYEMRDKSALYWWTAKIICISMVDEKGESRCIFGDDEKKLLGDFFSIYSSLESSGSPVCLIGKNSKDFDYPMIIGRALAHNVFIPYSLRRNKISDINDIFSYSKSCSQVGKLSDYAWGLDIKGKTSHGSQVKDMYNRVLMNEEGAWSTIAEYCINDSMIVHEMLKRYFQDKSKTSEPSEDLVIPF